MSTATAPLRPESAPPTRGARTSLESPVVAVGIGLIALQLIFRGTVLVQGWFYADDFEFLTEATGRSLSLTYLMEPHDSQFMPAGKLLAWLIAQAGPFNWAMAAAVIIIFQAAASVACWLMLLELFGARWQVLPFLCLYLFSTLTLTAFMWWSAAINQVPFQLVFFLAVTCHVRYLRTRNTRFAVATAALLVLGMCFYVKTVLIVVPLTFLTLLYFGDGRLPWRSRIVSLVADHRRVLALYAAVTLAFVGYYATSVPSPISPGGPVSYGDLLDALIRISLVPSALGGPWRWSIDNPPLGQVDSPAWAVTLAWMALAVVVTAAAHRRVADWRAAVVFVPYLAIAYFLVARGRGAQLGGFAGLELRYLADSVPVLTLAATLFFLRLREAASAGAPTTARSLSARRILVLGICVAPIAVGCVVSNLAYAKFWTDRFPAKAFMQTAGYESSRSPLIVVDEPVPELVMSATSYPSNLPSRMFAPLSEDRIQAATIGTDLQMLNAHGRPYPAVVTPGVSSVPGPAENCGYVVGSSYTPIRLRGQTDYFWWLQVSYLSAETGKVEVTVAGDSHEVDVVKGPHRLTMQGQGPIGRLGLRSLSAGGLCVDEVTIGEIEPFEALP